jgi:hypothetical protein
MSVRLRRLAAAAPAMLPAIAIALVCAIEGAKRWQ